MRHLKFNEDNKVVLQSIDINQESQLNAFMGQLRTTLDQPRINIVNYLNSSATYQDLEQAFSNATQSETRSGVEGKSLQYLGLNPSSFCILSVEQERNVIVVGLVLSHSTLGVLPVTFNIVSTISPIVMVEP